MAYNMPRLMLLPIDCGRCYSHFVIYLLFRLMLLPVGCGRCYCHFIASLSVLMADGIAKMSLVFCNHQC